MRIETLAAGWHVAMRPAAACDREGAPFSVRTGRGVSRWVCWVPVLRLSGLGWWSAATTGASPWRPARSARRRARRLLRALS